MIIGYTQKEVEECIKRSLEDKDEYCKSKETSEYRDAYSKDQYLPGYVKPKRVEEPKRKEIDVIIGPEKPKKEKKNRQKRHRKTKPT